MFGGYYSSMIVMIPAMIFTMIVQARIKRAFSTYIDIENSKRITGFEAARRMLDANGLQQVPINILKGDALTNYYDPRNNTVNLSSEIYNQDSIASVCIACHEVGHAIQHATGYAPVKMRNALVPVTNFAQNASWPLILLGIFLSSTTQYGTMLFNIGILCFVAVVLFHIVTLPVELNASSRALQQMRSLDLVDAADYSGSKKVLSAAAMTYVAALATAAAALIRILLIRGNRD
ncbi:zinc metallopeptidase [Mogibacterium pumilum]|uniref:Peptidase n=1 Tax=Mogibacterium pumilum TaxID=86332 RepID=A0A223ASV6_9FIRM|nr:zinc metallopeptidase [Mogibacterium pumilum]ASS38061.1 peptidase [Mogibacterium pumilum]